MNSLRELKKKNSDDNSSKCWFKHFYSQRVQFSVLSRITNRLPTSVYSNIGTVPCLKTILEKNQNYRVPRYKMMKKKRIFNLLMVNENYER